MREWRSDLLLRFAVARCKGGRCRTLGAAVAAARKLATSLGLSNVSFEHADIQNYLARSAGRFPITGPCHARNFEASGGARTISWEGECERIEAVVLTDADLYAIETLKAVGGVLTEDGLFISLDRSPTSASMWWYAQCLEQAGMKVSLNCSYLIEGDRPSQAERFPLTVARRARGSEPRTTPEEIVSLSSFKKLAATKMSFQDDLADVMVRSFGPTEVMFEAVCTFLNGSGVRTLRLLKTPTLLVLHDFTNHGFQAASLFPLVALPEALQLCTTITSEPEAYCAVHGSVTEDGKRWLARLDCPPE